MDFDKRKIDVGKFFFSGDSKFLKSCSSYNDLQEYSFNEIAFAGRSNVGKSSLINSLTNKRKLARLSKLPGRTRQLNFFQISKKDKNLIFVDLPGYGYAKAPKEDIKKWRSLTYFYFNNRVKLRTVCLLVDIRRDFYKHDINMMNYFDLIGLSWTLVLTKIDKVNKKTMLEKKKSFLQKLNKRSAAYPHLFLTSSRKKSGLDELKAYITSFTSK